MMLPNNVMSKKQINNQRRSSPAWVVLNTTLHGHTPEHKIDLLQEKMIEWAARAKNLTINPTSIQFRYRMLKSPSEIYMAMFYEQASNFQDHHQNFKNRDEFTKACTIICREIGIGFALPLQPFHASTGKLDSSPFFT